MDRVPELKLQIIYTSRSIFQPSRAVSRHSLDTCVRFNQNVDQLQWWVQHWSHSLNESAHLPHICIYLYSSLEIYLVPLFRRKYFGLRYNAFTYDVRRFPIIYTEVWYSVPTLAWRGTNFPKQRWQRGQNSRLSGNGHEGEQCSSHLPHRTEEARMHRKHLPHTSFANLSDMQISSALHH